MSMTLLDSESMTLLYSAGVWSDNTGDTSLRLRLTLGERGGGGGHNSFYIIPASQVKHN